MTHIIDKSFKEGIFLSELKLVKVVPIFKSGDSSKITNYRPISLLSLFSKVFKKVMYNHISDFIESVNVLYTYQFGFRQRHSTQHTIITLVNKIASFMDTGDLVIGMFFDLKRLLTLLPTQYSWINCMHMAPGETYGHCFAVTYQTDLSSFPMMIFRL